MADRINAFVGKIDDSTPTSRRSPNCFYVGDVLVGTFRDQPNFKGRICELFGGTAVLKNGYGGCQWVRLRDLQEDG